MYGVPNEPASQPSQQASKQALVLCCTALCCAVLHCTALCCPVLSCPVLCCVVLCCPILCCAAHTRRCRCVVRVRGGERRRLGAGGQGGLGFAACMAACPRALRAHRLWMWMDGNGRWEGAHAASQLRPPAPAAGARHSGSGARAGGRPRARWRWRRPPRRRICSREVSAWPFEGVDAMLWSTQS